jgi:diadenosine tetraphosphatase ApaH/serine/threonine PP2A family protein phosphatase
MNLDDFIEQIRTGSPFDNDNILTLLRMAQEVLFEEGSLISVSLPVTVCGDTHGQFFDLLQLFRTGGRPGYVRYLFLGDYVDRGFRSIENVCLLLAYKVKYRDSFFMLRGNHESRQVNTVYGFYDEVIERFGHASPWKLFNEVFDMLPLAAIVDNSIFCVHGGLSPRISLIEQIALLDYRNEIPESGPITDLLWSDPEERVPGWADNMRGAGCLFGSQAVSEFCAINSVDLIVRSHQLMADGYFWHFDERKLLTVWSAPNYCYTEENDASVLVIGEDRSRDLRVFSAIDDPGRVPETRLSTYFV